MGRTPAHQGDAYTYRNVITVVDELGKAGLVRDERARPGCLGWQSRMVATPALIARLQSLDKLRCAQREHLRLRNEKGRLVDYVDRPATRKMRRELVELNSAIKTRGPFAVGRGLTRRACGDHDVRWKTLRIAFFPSLRPRAQQNWALGTL